ncbi:hypothetical protein POM88_005525 [Heracleum sosnowskyi]|uniref:Uncharacterized protein n=1 Tax=Heracleum sosnowskyi TaxID=360622 RepID=A0AAD8J0X6_9APIA|nr:hypothetical protein POM88_005525 [Heracleum sosnowskyi]
MVAGKTIAENKWNRCWQRRGGRARNRDGDGRLQDGGGEGRKTLAAAGVRTDGSGRGRLVAAFPPEMVIDGERIDRRPRGCDREGAWKKKLGVCVFISLCCWSLCSNMGWTGTSRLLASESHARE